MSSVSSDDVNDAFAVFDKLGDKKIDISQVGELTRALGLNPTNADIKKMTTTGQYPGDRLTVDQFMPIFMALEKIQQSKDFDANSFKEGFRVFDNEGTGHIPAHVLRSILTGLGEKLTDQEADAILAGMVDSDGRIHTDKLVNNITSKDD